MISVCIITKNEKNNLECCLGKLSHYNFELVVVDTGSTDGTQQMVRQYTKSIFEYTWCNDFSKAKNFAISKAQNDMVLVIDSDEYLKSINFEELIKQIQKYPNAVGRIKRLNQFNFGNEKRENSEYINRLFDRRYFHYKGKIHEQIVSKKGFEYPTYITSIVIDHSGYLLSDQANLAKANRNIQLLKDELADIGPDPYILYQLGKSHYMKGEYTYACEYFSKALSFDLNPKLEYVIDMVDCYGYALLNSGQAETALSYEHIYEEFGCRADFQFLMGLIYMNNEQFDNAIQEFYKAANQKDCCVKGVNSYLAYYNAGVIYECLGNYEKALKLYEKCGDYEMAKKQIEVIRLK